MTRLAIELVCFALALLCIAPAVAGVCGDVQVDLQKAGDQQPTRTTQTTSSQGVPERRRIKVLRVTEPIKIDGQLDEPAWSQAEPASDFRQQEPTEGAPQSEKTEVRVLYDEKNLYVGIRAFDSEANHINARELVRDASFYNDDKIEVLLDTYNDRRNAFRFTVNPLGTQQDALITDEGRDVNLSWDASWITSGRIDQTGWTVEIAIPLTTLRFKEGEDTWGFNVARIIRRKNEEDLWTSWQRSFGLERVSQAGELIGVGEIKRRRLYEVKPYLSGGWVQGVPRVGAGLERPSYSLQIKLTRDFTF